MDFIDAIQSLVIPTWEADVRWKNEYRGEYSGNIKSICLPAAMKELFRKRLEDIKKDEFELKIFCSGFKFLAWFFGKARIDLNGEIKRAKGRKEKIVVHELVIIIKKLIREENQKGP
jgi:hypothetical protein